MNCTESIMNTSYSDLLNTNNTDDLDFDPFCIEFESHNFDQDIDIDINSMPKNYSTSSYYTMEQMNSKFQNSTSTSNGFSSIHFNARSIKANFRSILTFIESVNIKFCVIAISETWLHDGDDINQFAIDGYVAHYVNRSNKRGGGVAIYVSKIFDVCKINELSECIDNCMEVLTINMKLNKLLSINVACIYRPPGSDINLFNENLCSYLNKRGRKNMFICGDFNINLLNSDTNVDTATFTDTMFSSGLYPLINKPTRVTKDSSTLIDNIFTSELFTKIESGICISDISDHFPVFQVCSYKNVQFVENEVTTVCSRLLKDNNINNFMSRLDSIPWDDVLNNDDINSASDKFIYKFCDIYDDTCPKVKRNINSTRNVTNKPWMSKSLVNACHKKNYLYKCFLKKRNTTTETRYKSYKNKLTSILRHAEKLYYQTKLMQYKNNIKETWKILNEVICKRNTNQQSPNEFVINGETVSNQECIAKEFNDFFVNIGKKLANNIDVNQNDRNVKDYIEKVNNSFFLSPVTEEELIDVVKGCKCKYSCDYLDINMFIVKKVIKCIAKPLTYICNLSFQQGTFPEFMKIAKVLPLFKAGDTKNVSNYRPVSVLSQFSKILEKLFNKRLLSFVNSMDILSNNQYGFRSNRSTALALTEMVEMITDAIDDSKYAIGIFIDLKKAFDTINHDILLQKVHCYGVRGVSSNWLKSYLTNRMQYVNFNGFESDRLLLDCGVPQGSVLGPTLFLLYINDLCKVSESLKFILFADDTNIFYTNKSYNKLFSVVNEELCKLSEWFRLNKLTLNVSKTNYMLFGRKQRLASDSNKLRIDDNEINIVSKIKFLGVLIDDKFSWYDHINFVNNKISKSLGIMYRAKYVLNEDCLLMLYNTLILPYLNYCCEVWGNTYESRLSKLIISQKRAIRYIAKSQDSRMHTNPLFYKYKCLKLIDLIKYKTCIVMFKANNFLLPSTLQAYFVKSSDVHKHNTRYSKKFHHQQTNSKLKSMCISTEGVILWNEICKKLKGIDNLVSLSKFKQNCKYMFIDNYM